MKKFVSKMLAGALGLSMLCGVAAAEGETYVSWYTFGDVYLSSVRTALDAGIPTRTSRPRLTISTPLWLPARTLWS